MEEVNKDKTEDIFRDTPVRYLGYSNEVGEAFRALVHVNVVRFSYAVASTYVCLDAFSKGQNTYKMSEENKKILMDKISNRMKLQNDSQGSLEEESLKNLKDSELAENLLKATINKMTKTAVLDTFVWQAFASVIIPGITINRICFFGDKLISKTTRMPNVIRKWTVTAVGLCSIPFIIHPIDNFVHLVMNKTIRKYYE